MSLVRELAAARIGTTFNFYRDGRGARLRRERLEEYLETRRDAPLVLVAEAPGYRGTRVSGVPLTSERQLTGEGPAEATATIVHRVLAELGLLGETLLWNAVPTHPHPRGRPTANRAPTRAEVEASHPFLRAVTGGRHVVAVGRTAAATQDYLPSDSLLLGAVRHPARGGAEAFRSGLRTILGAQATGGGEMDEGTVREHAEAHGQAIESGDLNRAGSDVAKEFLPHLGEIMSHMPRAVTRAEVLSVEPAGDDEFFAQIRYTGDDRETTLQSRWAEREGRPRIVDIQLAG